MCPRSYLYANFYILYPSELLNILSIFVSYTFVKFVGIYLGMCLAYVFIHTFIYSNAHASVQACILFVHSTDEKSQREGIKMQKNMLRAGRVIIIHMRLGNYPIDINRAGEFRW